MSRFSTTIDIKEVDNKTVLSFNKKDVTTHLTTQAFKDLLNMQRKDRHELMKGVPLIKSGNQECCSRDARQDFWLRLNSVIPLGKQVNAQKENIHFRYNGNIYQIQKDEAYSQYNASVRGRHHNARYRVPELMGYGAVLLVAAAVVIGSASMMAAIAVAAVAAVIGIAAIITWIKADTYVLASRSIANPVGVCPHDKENIFTMYQATAENPSDTHELTSKEHKCQ